MSSRKQRSIPLGGRYRQVSLYQTRLTHWGRVTHICVSKLTIIGSDNHTVWTPFHFMYENSTLCTNWFVHQANTAGAFIVHQANAAGAFIVHQGNVVEHLGSYIKRNGVHPQWIMACRPAPSHYLNQCWNIVNSNLRNKVKWNPKQNSCIFIQESTFENVVCEMASILSRPQCVNTDGPRLFPECKHAVSLTMIRG